MAQIVAGLGAFFLLVAVVVAGVVVWESRQGRPVKTPP